MRETESGGRGGEREREGGKKQAAKHFCQSGHVFPDDEESTFSPRWSPAVCRAAVFMPREHVLSGPPFRDDRASCARYYTQAAIFFDPDIRILSFSFRFLNGFEIVHHH